MAQPSFPNRQPAVPPPGGAFGPPVPAGSLAPPTPPPRPPGRGRRAWRPAVLAVVLAVAVLVTGGALLLLADRGGSGTSGTEAEAAAGDAAGPRLPAEVIDAEMAWAGNAPAGDGQSIEARGLWYQDGLVVKHMGDAITAFAAATGDEAWTFPLAPGEFGCRASVTADAGRIALHQGFHCEILTVLDIVTGEEVMSLEMTSHPPPSQFDVPAILGDTVAVGYGTGTGGAGYSISQEQQIWRTEPGETCPETGYAVWDDMFVSVVSCAQGAGDRGGVRATTESGRELWRWRVEEGEAFAVLGVLSVEPLVVYGQYGQGYGGGDVAFLVVDDARESVATEIAWDDDRHGAPCSRGDLSGCPLALVEGDRLYAVDSLIGNSIRVHDLTAGHALYEITPEHGGIVTLAGSVDGEVLLYEGPEGGSGVVRALDPATEETRDVMRLNQRAEERGIMTDALSRTYWRTVWVAPENALLLELLSRAGTGEESLLIAYR
ncbi:outer membrane protein assembly factor BamB family protein [Streptomyces litchfieldiae]|uniref:PQQ-binding-like beta-propeller repeat protein n=1 Tax=Streptomyces litchfieldiae TaxID=3075543 RepID=A0ABU2MJE6_9ACTN|nr:PQQ-binding-like beta-propeller repeat protein [Streptomyces sp. DSM 44938]MDT0341063.1 PQQ-binding-like beta-propeller repeat protein [Streptomyces sp. DSM 44938]